jgi:hypothetical protein
VTQQDSVLPKSLKARLCENGLTPAPPLAVVRSDAAADTVALLSSMS